MLNHSMAEPSESGETDGPPFDAAALKQWIAMRPGHPDNYPEILTAEEAAGLLRVHKNTLLGLIKTQGLPARKVGREWRLLKTAVLAWLAGDDHHEGAGP